MSDINLETETSVPEEHFEDRNDQKPKREGLAYELLDLVKTFVICAISVFLITTFVVKPVQVEGISMVPTLEDNEVGIMNVIDLKIHDINRYDVVVVSSKKTNGDNWVKRVIGMPGDTIYAEDDVVYVNGLAIDEPYLDTDYVKGMRNQGNLFTQDLAKVTLGKDEYFLMGDNRPVSHDSRAVGPFKHEDFVGKDVYVLYPFSKIKAVRNGAN